FCKISLKPLNKTSKYEGYNNLPFKNLFQSLKVHPKLGFTRKDFFIESTVKSRGMSISGLQQKLSLKLNHKKELVITDTDGEYILKPSPEAFPNASENEHCAMLTSRLFNVEAAPCGLICFSDNEPAYITKRFDRHGGIKIHQEDLAQGFGMESEKKYSQSYEAAGKLVHKMTNGKAAVVFDFFRRVVHAFVTGNDDMHLKNLSLQKLPGNTGLYYDRMTQHYDCLFTQAFDHISRSDVLALDLLAEEKDDVYTGYDFKLLGEKLGLREKLISNFIHDIIQKETALVDLINHSFMPDCMKTKAVSIVEQRMKALALGF
ncbi:MAG: HipA domain-containing protein, partial [Proteobacteria bacterium]|nr:HipA domain-containing protein [Pseudomonadota bacterium]